jgi:hypothetical protein
MGPWLDNGLRQAIWSTCAALAIGVGLGMIVFWCATGG